jgi:hypothetical protein
MLILTLICIILAISGEEGIEDLAHIIMYIFVVLCFIAIQLV